jgi:hypothetical protein
MAMIKPSQAVEPEIVFTNSPNPVETDTIKMKIGGTDRVKVGRDYGAEARGKVTFGAYQAAIQSPGVLSFSASIEEFDKNIEKYAQLIIKKTWEAQNG